MYTALSVGALSTTSFPAEAEAVSGNRRATFENKAPMAESLLGGGILREPGRLEDWAGGLVE